MLTIIASNAYDDKRKGVLHTYGMESQRERLRSFRNALGMTQQEVADICGISREAVAQWEAKDEAKRTEPETKHLQIFISWLWEKRNIKVPIGWFIDPDRHPGLPTNEAAPSQAKPKTKDPALSDDDLRILSAWNLMQGQTKARLWAIMYGEIQDRHPSMAPAFKRDMERQLRANKHLEKAQAALEDDQAHKYPPPNASGGRNKPKRVA